MTGRQFPALHPVLPAGGGNIAPVVFYENEYGIYSMISIKRLYEKQ